MENPEAGRLPDTEEKSPEFYGKDKGSAQIHGQIFEYKFCALSFLRATNKGYTFKLASNVKGLGAFDDVLVEYLDDNCSKKRIFLQLKSKAKRLVTMSELKSKNGDFSLRKYYDSYIQVEENFNCSEGEVKLDGSIDESLFIIYTNTDVVQELKSYRVRDFGEEEFLMTGGSVLQFNEEEHKAIYEHLQGLPKHREFLSRFRIIYSQADEKRMDFYIKSEIQHSMMLPESELELAYICYIDFVKNWWQNCNYFLQDTNCKENDPIRNTTDKVRTTLVAKILDQRKSELDDLSIKYKQSAITDIKQLIEPHKSLLIFAPGRSTTLTAAKIHQMLSATKHIILNLQQFARYKSEVMLVWKSGFDVLVLESQSSTENLQGIFNDIPIFLNECNVKKKFIFVSSGIGNIQQTSALRTTFSTNLTEGYDDWKFADIVTDTRMLLLEKKVYFQGTEIKLGSIVRNSDVGMLNILGSDSIPRLLENEKLSIGIPIGDTVQYYIDRTLLCNKDIKTRFPVQEETKPALKDDIWQEFEDSSSHREKDLGIETSPRLTPSTLIEVEGRVIFVIDEPGMGKSTLLSHLASETRKSHPDMWIVRVNINNYTRILNEFKTNGCDENGVIKLLTEAAQIKETDSLNLERRLFDNTCSSTGNMVVLIDGVDEVSPLYTEQVVQILGILIETKIKKIWVTSRNSIKGFPEQEFQCHSYSLMPFTETDQKCFLVQFWKEKFPEVKGECLEHLAQRVLELSVKNLDEGGNNFMEIPLQCLLLAEMFEENLQQYSTTATVELPQHINFVVLYDLYVEKKWDIYLSEKKISDRTNVNVLTDDNELHKTFIENHTAAAFVAILSAQQLEKLADTTIMKKANDFLNNIEKGEEKTGLIINVIEERPVFQHRTLAEYLVAKNLCDNISATKKFMREYLLESDFGAVRSMVDRILADKCPVHEAVLNSNVRFVTKLLRQKESISKKDHGERTPLHVAVSCRSPVLIRLILEHGADVSSVDTFLGLSPVEYASRMKDWEVLSLIMEKRPDIREQVLNGTNQDSVDCMTCASRAAAQYGRNDLLKYLIKKGTPVNMVLPGNNCTLLHEAVKSQQTETVKLLVQLGASTECQDSFERTPLHVAVETGNLEIIKHIVDSQETVQRETDLKHVLNPEKTLKKRNVLNVPDIDGNTPLHLGVAAGHNNILSYLISAGSDKNTSNMRGEYPLTLAAQCGKNDIVDLLMDGEVQCEEAQIGALRAAIVAGHIDTTDLLLRLGVPVNKGENEKPIHVASQLGRKKIFILLLQYGASLTSRTDSGNTALHLASEAGHLSLVKYLVEKERDYMCTLNYENETPLHLASGNGRDYLVTYFVKKGCNINAASAKGATCLHVACENGHYITVEYLLKHGAEINAMNSADQTPLHIAASRGHTKIVELLFLHNANFSLRDKENFTVLLTASINGHQDTVLFILQHGGNIDDTDGKGNTITHFAVANENYDIINFLWQRNVSLDVQNFDGDTPLLKSVREGKPRMIQYLVERNADINTQDNDGIRPLDIAVLNGKMEITRILLELNASSRKESMPIFAAARFGFLDWLLRFVAMGADINVKADNGESPLHVACESGQEATVQYLCEHGAILDWQDNNGNTALHVAVSNGHLGVTRVLVEKGANLCAADVLGLTALHIAAKGEYLNIVQYLADSFAPIDKRNAKNETALLVAAAEGHEKIVSFLIEQGAGIGVRNIEGKTAFDIATEKGHGVITQLLKDRAKGRILVCSNSHNDIHTATEGDISELLQRSLNAGESIATETENISTDTQRMFETTPEGTLDIQSHHRCALHTAVENSNFEQVQRLVKAGIALDCGDRLGRTALWGAAKSGHKSIITFLLQNGSCVNIPDCEGVTPLEIAAREGHLEAVDVIRMYDPTISPESSEYLKNMLHEASESGDLKMFQTILKCGISLETTNINGYTPLHVSAKCGYQEFSRMLLNFGANVNVKDNYGRTPLILSAENGHIDVVRELLNHGASVDIADEYGYTPLYAAAKEGHVDALRVLLNHDAIVNITDKTGITPLCAADQGRHVEVVRELLKHGAKMKVRAEKRSKKLAISSRLTVVLVSLLLATPAVIFWLWLMIQPTTEAIACPEECRCEWDGYLVNCSNSTLNSVPSILPTHARQLVLDGNNITYFLNGSFVSRGRVELDMISAVSCELRGIELGAFNGLTMLTYMSLESNEISEIIPGTFQKISRLEHLDLNYNEIQHLKSDTFSGLVKLKNLSLEGNKLQYIDPYTFAWLPNLQRLLLSKNPGLQMATGPHFIKSVSLKRLGLSDSNISSVSVQTFAYFSALEWLDLSCNKLRTPDINILRALPDLFELNLELNDISDIIPGTFRKFNRLEHLNLKYNKIEQLESDKFSGLLNLKNLSLEENKLQYIHPDTFAWLPNLQSLFLSKNPGLQVPTDSHFINSFSLKRLGISGCNISSMSVETFANLSALEWLDLSYNKLRNLDINVWKKLPKLFELNLEFNNIIEIEPFTFLKVISLEHINLNYNEIEKLDGYTFSGLVNLKNLSLEGNKLQYIHPYSIAGLPNLQSLILSKNPGLQIPNERHFINSDSLKRLGISGCNISLVSIETFANLKALKWLDLSYNKLKTLDIDILTELPELNELNLEFNNISEIKPDVLQVSRLEHLNLNYNKIEQLEIITLTGLLKLKILSLEGNKLQYIHPHALAGLPNLQRLILSKNPGLPIPTDRHFINSFSLKRLGISGCNISSVSGETFANLSALEWLDLSYNKLKTLDINILTPLPELSELNLEFNNIREIIPGKSQFRRLNLLNLNYNEIEEVNGYTFSGLVNLRNLSLEGNRLQHIHPRTFAKSTNLQSLLLSKYPGLEISTHRQFIYSGSLKRLSISGSNISSVSIETFGYDSALEWLDLSYNKLRTLDIIMLTALPELVELNLEFNHISEIIPDTIQVSRLEHLNLNYNKIEQLESDTLSGLVNLKTLSLEGNTLQYIVPDTFAGLPKLQRLFLSKNSGLQLPNDRHFIYSDSLKRLGISGCNISSMSVETFLYFSALEWLDLSYNNLNTVDITILKVLSKLSTLHLYGNPLHCDCKLQELWRWCEVRSIQTAYKEMAPTCDTPSEVEGIWWGILERGQCLLDNIQNYGDYKNTSYSYTPIEGTDRDKETKQGKNVSSFLKQYELPVSVILSIFGTTGNVILIFIIISNKNMRTVPNMYILNLAISDMIYLTAIFSTAWLDNITWLRDVIVCTFLPFCIRMSVGLTMNFLTVLSIWVYKLRVNPFNVRVSSQPAWCATVGTIFGVWILAALFAVPAARSQYMCVNSILLWHTKYYLYVIAFQTLVSFVLPFFAICFFFTYGQYLAKKSLSLSVETQNSRKSTAKLYAVLSVGFTIIVLFYHMAELYFYSNISLDLSSFKFGVEIVSDYNLRDIIFILQILLSIKSCLNPVVLFFISLAFRSHFKHYLTCCYKTNFPPNVFELTEIN